MAGEFDLIAKHFRPLAGPEALGLVDDAACMAVPDGFELVITKDLLVEGVHFIGNEPPETLAIKALGANLSDLAAKGARPRCYFLGLALPAAKAGDWVAGFAAGLGRIQQAFGLTLGGGDTTASPGPVCISITAIGEVPRGGMIQRSGARAGDDVWVSGTLGDAALGLKVLQGEITHNDFLAARYVEPQPRVALGLALRGIATAAADISDGLLADLGHVCDASGVGALVHEADLPVSEAMIAVLAGNPALSSSIYSGGDDYELVFTAPAEAREKIAEIGEAYGLRLTQVGTVEASPGIRLVDPEGQLVQTARTGFQHFENKD